MSASSSSSSSSSCSSGASQVLGVRESISGRKFWLDANGDEVAICGGKACVYLSGDRVALRSCQKVSLIVTRRQKQSVLRHGNVMILQPKDTFYANGTLTKYEVIMGPAMGSSSVASAGAGAGASAATKTATQSDTKTKPNAVTSRFFQAQSASSQIKFKKSIGEQKSSQATKTQEKDLNSAQKEQPHSEETLCKHPNATTCCKSSVTQKTSASKRSRPCRNEEAKAKKNKMTMPEATMNGPGARKANPSKNEGDDEEEEEEEETPSRPNRVRRSRVISLDEDDSEEDDPKPQPHKSAIKQQQEPAAIEVDSIAEEDDVFLLDQQQASKQSTAKWMEGFAYRKNQTSTEDRANSNGWISVAELKSGERKPAISRQTTNRNRPSRMETEDDDDDSDNAYENRSHGELSQLLKECTRIGQRLRNAVKEWSTGSSEPDNDDEDGTTSASSDGEVTEQVTLCSFNSTRRQSTNSRIITEKDIPELCKTLELKPYQTVGVNWLLLLYRNNLSGVLADEMGLGKTVQAICCLQYLHSLRASENQDSNEPSSAGPHLIVVPASVLSNWQREFAWIAPSLRVVIYHGAKKNRYELQEQLDSTQFDVLLTTYTYFERDTCQEDRIFLKSFRFKYLILDEGHSIKNFKSSRFKRLTCMRAQIRLVLSGTPIQNNLNELLALLSFLMPKMFDHGSDELLSFFDGTEASKSKQIRRILAPFILRREKRFVLNQLVPKTMHVEMLALDTDQRGMYDELLEKVVQQKEQVATHREQHEETKARRKSKLDRQVQMLLGDSELFSERELKRSDKKHQLASSDSAIFTQLRKAANHPVLLRKHFVSEDTMETLARELHRVQAFGTACTQKMVRKELDTYCDFELHDLCVQYATSSQQLQKMRLPTEILLKSAKFDFLRKLLPELQAEGHRMLIFSQWTRLLDLLEYLMDFLHMRFLRLDGSTQVSTRQALIDEFNEDKGIGVFLLSTRAGGLGVNLTAADVVILHDLDFNPSNDEQACDRCHRIGQTKPVTIYKLVAQDTVDHEIYRIGQVKTQLNDAVLGKLNARIDSSNSTDTGDEKIQQQLASEDGGPPAVTVEMLLASVLSTYKKNL